MKHSGYMHNDALQPKTDWWTIFLLPIKLHVCKKNVRCTLALTVLTLDSCLTGVSDGRVVKSLT